jgi:hypothetical protein
MLNVSNTLRHVTPQRVLNHVTVLALNATVGFNAQERRMGITQALVSSYYNANMVIYQTNGPKGVLLYQQQDLIQF